MANCKYEITNEYEQYKTLIFDIQNYFLDSKATIHKARNELKVIHFQGEDFVVKAFQKPNLFRRIIYSFFRASKAKKSYTNAVRLQTLGINTPAPVAYLEFYVNGLLCDSFYISKKLEYDFTIRKPLLRDKTYPDREKILKKFAVFTALLHQKGVYHKDYSPGNILIKQLDGQYSFYLVDINRMEFKSLSFEDKASSLSQLWADEDDLDKIATVYIKALKEKPRLKSLILQKSKQHKKQKEFKNKLKKVCAK